MGSDGGFDSADRATDRLTPHSGAWYQHWRLVSLDGTTLDTADEQANAEVFGYPGCSRGEPACPQLRCVGLLENGTRVLFATEIGAYRDSEITLAHRAVTHLQPDMLCLADHGFFGLRYGRCPGPRQPAVMAPD